MKVLFFAPLIIYTFSVSISFGAAYGGGNGTATDPYLIWTAEQMNTIGANNADWNKNFKLMADVNMAEYSGTKYNIIGDWVRAFYGTFDGNGHVIKNLKINRPFQECIGLFGHLSSGQILNLGVVDANVIGGTNVGALLGKAYNSNIRSCYSTGAVSGRTNTGGLLADNSCGTVESCYSRAAVTGLLCAGGLIAHSSWGTVKSCYSTGNVTSPGMYNHSEAGGLIGYNQLGTVIFCFSTGDVTGTAEVGGLIGINNGSVASSYSTGKISASRYYAGGLIADNSGAVSSCYTTATVTGTYYVGGIAGSNYLGAITSCYSTGNCAGNGYIGGVAGFNNCGLVLSCYSKGDVKASGISAEYIGGLVGQNEGTVLTCYSIGNVPQGQSRYAGGLVGLSRTGTVLQSFWDTQTSAMMTSGGGEGKTTAEMKDIQTYMAANWDFVNEQDNGIYDFWQMPENDYPSLAEHDWQLAGDGMPESPYVLMAPQDLASIWQRPGGYYLLHNDLDLSGMTWFFAAVPGFGGIFDGNGHIVKNFALNQPSLNNAAVFGFIEPWGQILNTGFEDANVVGKNYIGSVTGYNSSGVIKACYSTGKVTGMNYVGGLAGCCGFPKWTDSTINSCYSKANVCGTQNIGGLVGYQEIGVIRSCYSTGTVTGSINIGGLAGYKNSGLIVGSFWDTQTSGTAISAGGTGLETPVMRTKITFTAAGWDFIGETGNGTEDIWMIHDGTDYPKFVWQNKTPEADAGLDKNCYAFINDKAIVELDGSGSSDADGGALTYKWTWETDGKIYEANGMRPTIELPVGVHTIQLVVNDGIADSVPDDVSVTVVAAAAGILKITPNAINSKNNQEQICAMISLPSGMSTNDLDESWTMTMYPGEIKPIKQTYQAGGTEILAIFDKNTVCAAGTGNVEFKVAGKLKSGQYFYGSDKIKIIH